MWCALQSASQDLPQGTTYTLTSSPNCEGIVATTKKVLPSFNLKALDLDKEIDLLTSHPVTSTFTGIEDVDSEGEAVESTSHTMGKAGIPSSAVGAGDSNNNCTKIEG